MKLVPAPIGLLLTCMGVASLGCADLPLDPDDADSETVGDGDGDDETGDGDGDEHGDTGESEGDGDGGDGDGDGEGDGDGDGDPAECGNGEVEADEACDDGNDIDEDDCTNACALPICGDGIVTASLGETCDDGNTTSGDGCLATCVLPGALISEVVIDIGDQTTDIGHEVVIDSADNIAVLLETNGSFRLVEYDPELAPVWNFAALLAQNPTLAIGPNDELVVGGRLNNQGSTRKYDSNGNHVWTRNVAVNNSWISSVAVDAQGTVVSAGYQPDGGNDDALILQYSVGGTLGWSVVEDNSNAYGPIAVDASGQVFVIRKAPRQLEHYAGDGMFGWASETLPDGIYHELAVDPDGNVYVLASAPDSSLFSLHKVDNTGALVWSVDHDHAEVLDVATGFTLLPGGAILVAGTTNGSATESDGLLSWYDADGNLLHELVIDGVADEDLDTFLDVAVGPGGDHAVAVGGRLEAGGDANLWIYKFEI